MSLDNWKEIYILNSVVFALRISRIDASLKVCYNCCFFLLRLLVAEGADVDVAYTDGKNNEMTTLINECVRRENETLYTVAKPRSKKLVEVGCLQFLLDSGANVDFAVVRFFIQFITYIEV